MTGEIHEISAALGQLRAEAQQASASRRVLHEKLDGIAKSVGDIAKLVEVQKHRIDKVEPVVENLERMRNRGLGVLACITVVSGGVGAAVSQYIAKAIAKGWSP